MSKIPVKGGKYLRENTREVNFHSGAGGATSRLQILDQDRNFETWVGQAPRLSRWAPRPTQLGSP